VGALIPKAQGELLTNLNQSVLPEDSFVFPYEVVRKIIGRNA
jgi:hypothetical protein